jgi:alpha-D-ribose 1-methylphosphonate 5-triphosphate diphosphatase PhnM
MNKTILTNARIVLPNETIEGSLVIEGDRIAEIIPARRRISRCPSPSI